MPTEGTTNEGEKVAAISGLLGGQPPKEDPGTGQPAAESPSVGDDVSTGQDEGSGELELTPKAIAERLGISPAEFMRGLTIPVDGGDPLTLEQFKDAGKELRTVKDAQGELAESRVRLENDAMTQRQQLQALLGKIPAGAVSEETISEIQSEHTAYVDTERKALLAIRPDLKDSAKWNGTRDLLLDHLKPYGFHAVEIDKITDHRLAKYVIDNAEREKRVADLKLGAEKPGKPLQGSKPKPRERSARRKTETTVQRGQRATSNRDKAAAVAELLGTTK